MKKCSGCMHLACYVVAYITCDCMIVPFADWSIWYPIRLIVVTLCLNNVSVCPFKGGKEYLMRAHFGLPSVVAENTEGKPPIHVKFEIPYFTVSGIQVMILSRWPMYGIHV